jgi:hypothetical protein
MDKPLGSIVRMGDKVKKLLLIILNEEIFDGGKYVFSRAVHVVMWIAYMIIIESSWVVYVLLKLCVNLTRIVLRFSSMHFKWLLHQLSTWLGYKIVFVANRFACPLEASLNQAAKTFVRLFWNFKP